MDKPDTSEEQNGKSEDKSPDVNLKRKHESTDEGDLELPKELKAMFGALACKLCGVVSSSPMTALTHYKGKVHKRKVLNYLIERGLSVNLPAKKEKTDTEGQESCSICNVFFTSEATKREHFSGKKHRKRLFSGDVKIQPIPAASCDSSGRFGIGSGFTNPSDTEDKSEVPPSKSQTYCSLCHVSVSSPVHLESHFNGAKHKKRAAAEAAKEKDNLEF